MLRFLGPMLFHARRNASNEACTHILHNANPALYHRAMNDDDYLDLLK